MASVWSLVRSKRENKISSVTLGKRITLQDDILIMESVQEKNPIWEVLMQMKLEERVICCYYSNSKAETFEHLFCGCPDTEEIWKRFVNATGIIGPFNN